MNGWRESERKRLEWAPIAGKRVVSCPFLLLFHSLALSPSLSVIPNELPAALVLTFFLVASMDGPFGCLCLAGSLNPRCATSLEKLPQANLMPLHILSRDIHVSLLFSKHVFF